MVSSLSYNSWRRPVAQREFRSVSEARNKFGIERAASGNSIRSNTENNKSSINFNTSRRGANTYNFVGRNSNKNLSYENTMGRFRQLMLDRYGFNGNVNLHKETERAPKVKVNRVENLKGEDFSRLYNSATNGPLANHVMESGVYKDKRYVVLDNVRYESTILKSERLKTQKFQWMR